MSEEKLNHIKEVESLKSQLEETKLKYSKAIERLEHLKYLTSNISDIIWVLDPVELKFKYISQSVFNILGYTSQECINMPISDLFTTDSLQLMNDLIHLRFLEFKEKGKKKNYTDEFTLIHKNDALIYTEGVSFFQQNETSGKLEIIGTTRDITQRIKSDAALKESEEKYRALFLAAGDAAFVFQDNKIIDCNDRALKILKGKRKDILGLTPWDISPEKQPDGAKSKEKALSMINTLYQGAIHEFEWLHKNLKNELIDVEISLSVVDAHNNVFISTWRDISKRKKNEEKLRQKDYIIESASSPIATADLDGSVTYANPAFMEKWGFKDSEEFLGRPFTEFWMLGDGYERIMNTLINKGRWAGEVNAKKKDGSFFNVQVSAAMVHDKEGIPVSLMSSSVDITEQKKAVTKLLESEEQFRSLMEQSPIGISIQNPDGSPKQVNAALMKLWGINHLNLTEFYEKYNLFKDKQVMELGLLPIIEKAFNGEVVFLPPFEYNSQDTFNAIDFSRNEGKKQWVQVRLYPVKRRNGSILNVVLLVEDITEQKSAEKSLRENEKRIRAIFEYAPIAMAQLDMEGHPVLSNKALVHMVGYSEEELKNMVFTEFTYPDDVEIDIDLFKEMLNGKRDSYNIEKRYIHKNGRLIWANLHVGIVRDEQGKPAYIIGMVEDITQRKIAEEALKESESRNRLIIDNVPVVIWKTSSNGKTEFISDNVERVYGFTPSEIYEKGKEVWLDRIHNEDSGRVKKEFEKLFMENIPFNIEYRIKTKDGKWIWLHDFANTVHKENGNMFAYGVFYDITDTKRVQNELIESEKKYRSIFENSNDGYLISDKDKKIVSCSQKMCDLIGYTQEELVGRDYKDFLIDKEKDWDALLFDNVKEYNTHTTYYELGSMKKDGEIIPVEVSIYLLNFHDTIYYLGVVRDIRERKRLEKEVYNSMITSEEKERERYAKELHDGLGPILSTSMIYLYTMLEEKNRETLEGHISKTYGLLEDAVQSIREISNNLSPDILKKFGIVQAVRSFIEKSKSASLINFIIDSNLEYRFPELIEFTVYRTIIELVNNSIKYSKANRLQIDINYIEGMLNIHIVDNGIGFDYEKVKEKAKGFGLMNLENRIQKLGGQYHYFSNPGKGTKVEIIIQTNYI